MRRVVFLAGALVLPFGPAITLPETTRGWLAIVSNGTFYMFGYWLFFEACRLIGVTRASILTLVDPLLATLIAIIFLEQFLTGAEWAGFVIILMALVVFEMKKQAATSR